MKIILLIMISLFTIACASYQSPERDVASQDEKKQTKKVNHFQQYRGFRDYR